MAFSADGRLGAAADYAPEEPGASAHLEHGGAFADTLTLFGADVGKPVEVPLDELERYAVRPFGIAITPDKSRMFITCGGSEMVTVVDVPRLIQLRAIASRVECAGYVGKRELCGGRGLRWGMIRGAWR